MVSERIRKAVAPFIGLVAVAIAGTGCKTAPRPPQLQAVGSPSQTQKPSQINGVPVDVLLKSVEYVCSQKDPHLREAAANAAGVVIRVKGQPLPKDDGQHRWMFTCPD